MFIHQKLQIKITTLIAYRSIISLFSFIFNRNLKNKCYPKKILFTNTENYVIIITVIFTELSVMKGELIMKRIFFSVIIFLICALMPVGCELGDMNIGGNNGGTGEGGTGEDGIGNADPATCKHESLKLLEEVKPGCTSDGLTEGVQCYDCGSIVIAQDVIKGGHTYGDAFDEICNTCGEERVSAGSSAQDCLHERLTRLAEVKPGCTSDGLAEGAQCYDCGSIVIAQDVIKGGHTYDGALDNVCNACGEERNALSSITYDNSEVTITFYHTMGASMREILDKYIEQFNKLYPNIHVNHIQAGSYDDLHSQVKAEIAGGTAPNLAYCYPEHVGSYNKLGATVPLDALISSTVTVTRADGSVETMGLTDEQKADFFEAFYNQGRNYGDGLMYSLPFLKSTEVLYYNKTFFEDMGLSVPTTWEEMWEVCEQIKKLDPKSTPLGYDSESNLLFNLFEQYGYDYASAEGGGQILFNNPDAKALFKMLREKYQAGLFNVGGINGSYYFAPSNGGGSYMVISSSASAVHQVPDPVSGVYPFEVGIAPLPQVNADNGKVITQGPSLCILNTDNQNVLAATWLFTKFITTSAELQAEVSLRSGYLPTLKSAYENEIYKDYLALADGGKYIFSLSVNVSKEQEDRFFTPAGFNGSGKLRDELGDLICEVLGLPDAGLDAAIDKAFSNAVRECEDYE